MSDAERPEDSREDVRQDYHDAGGEDASQELCEGAREGSSGEAETAAENWPESGELEWSEASEQEMEEYTGTLRRLEWMILGAGAVCAAAVLLSAGLDAGRGSAIGDGAGMDQFPMVGGDGERDQRANCGGQEPGGRCGRDGAWSWASLLDGGRCLCYLYLFLTRPGWVPGRANDACRRSDVRGRV